MTMLTRTFRNGEGGAATAPGTSLNGSLGNVNDDL
jgi:hypothetical protein